MITRQNENKLSYVTYIVITSLAGATAEACAKAQAVFRIDNTLVVF